MGIPGNPNAILEIHDVAVQRGARTVLAIDRLQVDEGEVLAVIGPNGAGKSTLFLALARLIPIARGQILLRGQSQATLDDLAYRRQIALVLQEPLLLDMTVFENVAAGLRYRRLHKAEINRRVREWLGRLGVAELVDRQARQLSGGEAQRVSLADISQRTKVGMGYLQAIEQDDFAKLPALVYTTGFVVEVARFLKLDPQQTSRSYIRRYKQYLDEKQTRFLRRQ